MTDTAVIIPFGKYKGAPIEEVAARDPQYLAWLQTQDWFLNKFEYLLLYLTLWFDELVALRHRRWLEASASRKSAS